MRINGTNYELGDAICRSSVDALMDDEKTISSSSEFKRSRRVEPSYASDLLIWSAQLTSAQSVFCSICSICFLIFFFVSQKRGAYFFTLLPFSLPLSNLTSRFTFIHAHKFTHTTLFILVGGTNKTRFQVSVLLRRSLMFPWDGVVDRRGSVPRG